MASKAEVLAPGMGTSQRHGLLFMPSDSSTHVSEQVEHVTSPLPAFFRLKHFSFTALCCGLEPARQRLQSACTTRPVPLVASATICKICGQVCILLVPCQGTRRVFHVQGTCSTSTMQGVWPCHCTFLLPVSLFTRCLARCMQYHRTLYYPNLPSWQVD